MLAPNTFLKNPKRGAFDSQGNLYIAENSLSIVSVVDFTTGKKELFAGNGNSTFSSLLGVGGPAKDATITSPLDVAVDSNDNVYIAAQNAVWFVDKNTKLISVLVGDGSFTGSDGNGGQGTAAHVNFNSSGGLASTNPLYMADEGGNQVRKLDTTTGIITAVAGTGTAGFSGDGAAATSGQLEEPGDVFVDASNNIFIADVQNHRIRKVDAGTGFISTVAGSGATGFGNGSFSGDGAAATSATLDEPNGVWLDAAGNIFIADKGNHRIRRVDVGTGFISTFAGSAAGGAFSGDGGPATSAQLLLPTGVEGDGAGNIFIFGGNSRVRKVDTGGTITTIVGNGGVGDGLQATNAFLQSPGDIWLDAAGNYYIADNFNHRIRKVDRTTGVITTFAGTGMGTFGGDGGLATLADLCNPKGVFLNSTEMYIGDSGNHVVRKIDLSTNIITTVGGMGGSPGFSGDGGVGTSAQVNDPRGLVVVGTDLYFADTINHRIRKIDTTTGNITTIAGSGATGFGNGSFSGDGGVATSATLSDPYDVEVDDSGNFLYIADQGNERIRRVDLTTNIITTVAGTGSANFSGDGGLATAAELDGPKGVFVTGTGSKVTISDGDNNVIRTFMTGGNIDRVGGVFAGSSSSGWGFEDNADALLAKFADPQGLFCETNGAVELALFIADSFNNVIRKITFVTITETTAALGLSGTITKFPGDRVQVLSLGLTGDGVSTLTSFTLTISGSILASHIAGVELYASSNNTFDSTDKFIGSAAAVIDGPTTITTTETISTTETFYIAVVVLSSSDIPDDGRSFTVGAAAGFVVTSGGNFGTAVTASSSNKVTIDILEAVITLPVQSTGFTGSPIAASGAIATCNGQAISVTYTYTETDQSTGETRLRDGPPTGPGDNFGVTATAVSNICTGSTSRTLSISAPAAPQVTISATPSSGSPGVMVTLTIQVTGFSQTTFVESNDATNKKLDESYSLATSKTFTLPTSYQKSATATVFATGPGGQTQASVGIAINQPPTAEGQNLDTMEDVPLPLTLKGTDPEGDGLSYSIDANPSNGTLSGTAPDVTYTPSENYHGPDSFTFKVNDGTSDSNVATVSIDVQRVDDPPVISPAFASSFTALEDNDLVIETDGHAQDVDTPISNLVFGAQGFGTDLVAGVAVGSLVFTPVQDAFGSTPATITLTDPATGDFATQDVTLEWTSVNDAPEIIAVFPLDGATEVTLNPQLTGEAKDVDGDELSFDIFLAEAGEAEQLVASGVSTPIYNATDLRPGASYTVRMVASDPSAATAEYSANFETEADRTPPKISSVQTSPGVDFLTFSWRTDERANSAVFLRAGNGSAKRVAVTQQSAGEFSEIDNELVTDHEITVGGLNPGIQYSYSLSSQDAAGNTSNPFEGTTLTLRAPDTTPPEYLIDPFVEGITDEGAVVRWRMSEPSTGIVRYRALEASAKIASILQDFQEIRVEQLIPEHSVPISGLPAETDIEVNVLGEDAAGNPSELRTVTFTTAASPDLALPEFTASPALRGVSDTEINLDFETDELTEAWIRFDIDDNLTDGRLASATQVSTKHAITLAGLSADTKYFLRVFIRDLSGNQRLSDLIEITTKGAPDTDPASVVAGPAWEGITETAATFIIGTDELSRIRLLVSEREDLQDAIQKESLELQESHSIPFTNLTAATVYFYEANVEDRARNPSEPLRGDFSTLAAPDVTPPEIVDFFAQSVGFDRASLRIRSNELVTGTIEIVPQSNAKILDEIGSRRLEITEAARVHDAEITQLESKTGYAARVVLRDAQNNEANASTEFDTKSKPDETFPLVETGPDVQGVSAAGGTAAVTFNEAVEMTALISTSPDFAGADQLALTNRERTKRASFTRLEADTRYYVRLLAKDAAGNSAPPIDLEFTTDAAPDVTGPVYVQLPVADNVSQTTADIVVKLDEPADLSVELATDDGFTSAGAPQVNLDRLLSHVVTWSGLLPNTTHFFRITASDASGNSSLSDVFSFTTLEEEKPPVQYTAGPSIVSVEFDRAQIFARTNGPTNLKLAYHPVDDREDVTVVVAERGTEFNLVLTNLAPNTTYAYTVSGAEVDVSGELKTKEEPDIISPQILGIPSVVLEGVNTFEVGWETSEISDSKLDCRAGAETFEATDPADVKDHHLKITNAPEDTEFSCIARSTDPSGNTGESKRFAAHTIAAPDETPPVFVKPAIVQDATVNSITVSFSTDENSTAIVDYGRVSGASRKVVPIDEATPSAKPMQVGFSSGSAVSDQPTTEHEILILGGVRPETTYRLRVRVWDTLTNGPTEALLEATTPKRKDKEPPIFDEDPFPSSVTSSEAQIKFSASEPVRAILTLDGRSPPEDIPEYSESHLVPITNLDADHFYTGSVRIFDAAGNENSGSLEFRTDKAPDETNPRYIDAPVARFKSIKRRSARVVFSTDEPTKSTVEWKAVDPSGKLVSAEGVNQSVATSGREQDDFAQLHKIDLENLPPGREIEVILTNSDLAGNTVTTDPKGTEAHSVRLSFETKAKPDTRQLKFKGKPVVDFTDRIATFRFKTNKAATSVVNLAVFGRPRRPKSNNEYITDHSVTVWGLQKGSYISYDITATDRSGFVKNSNEAFQVRKALADTSAKRLQPPGGDGFFVTSYEADTQFPLITSGPEVLEKTASSMTVGWQTDEVADSFVRFGTDDQLEEVAGSAANVRDHRVTLTNLAPGNKYFYQVESSDATGNGATKSALGVISTSVELDLAPPRFIEDPHIAAKTDEDVVLRWRTDEAASASVGYVAADDEVFSQVIDERRTTQQVTITNLEADSQYEFSIDLFDASQNRSTESFVVTVRTDSGPDLDPPQILDGPAVVAVTDVMATVIWTTDEIADSYVDFDSSPYLGSVVGSTEDVLEHRVTLTNLSPATTYNLRVGSSDRAGNGPTASQVVSFATLAEPDRQPPDTPAGLQVLPGSAVNLVVWEPNQEQDLGGYSLYREESGVFEVIATNLRETRFLDQGLDNGQLYRYRLSASDNQAPPNESEPSDIAEATPGGDLVSGQPLILGLEDGAVPQRPVVVIQNAIPLAADTELTYTVHISTSSSFTNIVARGGNIPEGFAGATRWRVTKDLVPTRSYWWRARAFDGQFEGAWSEPVRLRPNQASAPLTSEDFNGDGTVSFGDFFILANGFGSSDPILDLDRDGTVGSPDLALLKQRFGESVSSKLVNAQGAEIAAGSHLDLSATAFDDGAIALRLRLHELPKLSGYGFSIRVEPPILEYLGLVDTALTLGTQETRLQLVHEESGLFAFGDHLRGRQSAVKVDADVGVDMLFRLLGAPRDVQFFVEEGLVGRGAGRAWRVERLASAKVVPTAFALYANYPNPFNPATNLPIAIPRLSDTRQREIKLAIYNVLGQRMWSRDLSDWSPGFHSVAWDGLDAQGRASASGIYMVRLTAGSFDQTRKLLLLR